MTELLSIIAAAREAPDRIAIATASGAWTFAQCAELIRLPERALIARPAVETVLAIYAALEARRPLALLHHRLAADELARQHRIAEGELPDDTAAVLFTSGSTGASRGVALSRTALEAAALASTAHLGWHDGDRWLLALSMAHAGGLSIVVRCLAGRRPVGLCDHDFDRDRTIDRLDRECTIASLVPTQLAALLDAPTWRPWHKLRAILLGGAAAPPALLERAAARGVPFLTTYGMTETLGQIATAAPARAGDPRAPLVLLPGVEVHAGTPDAPAPIELRGAMLATRYLGGAAIAPAFTTADLGYLDARGALIIAGRRDDVIITGGENVHPSAIEAVLAATPGVRAACVFGVADERWGQVVGAALVVEPDFDLAAAATAWHASLPAHARPRQLARCAALPQLPSGKVDRRAAAALPRLPISY